MELLVAEEVNMIDYKFESDKQEINAVVHIRKDQKDIDASKEPPSPILDTYPFLRLDMVYETPPKLLFDILKESEKIPEWMQGACLSNKVVDS